MNRGTDKAADFFPASRFRETYYRPDVIDRILETRDGAEALRLANEAAGKRSTNLADAASTIEKKQPPTVELATEARKENSCSRKARRRQASAIGCGAGAGKDHWPAGAAGWATFVCERADPAQR